MTNRLPPQNLDAERGVIGSVLLDDGCLVDVVAILPTAAMFYRDTHARIWAAMLEMFADGARIDLLTLADRLGRDGVKAIGGDATLAAILDATPHAANAAYYAAIVRQKAIKRELIGTSEASIADCYADDDTAETVLDRAASRLFAIHATGTQSRMARACDVMPRVLDAIDARTERRTLGLPTGFADLDAILCGMKPGAFYVVAARPAMGKSAFGMALCEYASLDAGIGSLFVSLEMASEQLIERLAVARSRADGRGVATGRIAAAEYDRFTAAVGEINAAPLFVDDTPGMGILQITAGARRLRQRADIGLVVVDYLQLIEPDDDRANRQEQVAKVSRRMKALARELTVPVVALAQLNRQVEARDDKTPRLSDLRDSGSIEQDADVVIFLHRPEYYDPNDSPGVARVIVSKNRHGSTGVVNLAWSARSVAFASLSNTPDFGDAPGMAPAPPF